MDANRIPSLSLELPTCLLEKMKDVGGNVISLAGEDYHHVQMSYGDESWMQYEEWACAVERDPVVLIGLSPGPLIIKTILCPGPSLWGPIQIEAASIMNHVWSLPANAFTDGFPVIPGPLSAPLFALQFERPQLALSVLVSLIQSPPVEYPVLSSLRSGSYMCTVQHIWRNAFLQIAVYKP